MNYRFLSTVVTLVVVLQIHISGTVVYQDDFSNAVTSYQNWISSDDYNKPAFADGVCKVVNSSPTSMSYVSHKITLPSTFTYSCTSIRDNDQIKIGIAFYIEVANNTVKYFNILLQDRYIFIFTPETDSVNGIPCPYLDAKVNKCTISRKGATYNIFINDKFAATFSDDKARNGDIGFLNFPNTTVSYDNVVVTDQYLEPVVRKCYVEKFDDTSLKFWEIMGEKNTRTVENGKLTIKTENNENAQCVLATSLKLTNFVIRVEVSHIEGSGQSTYGLRLFDSSYNRIASFMINGNRAFGSSLDTNSFEVGTSTSIFGKAATIEGQHYIFTDTLEVAKPANSSHYFFVVNNDTIDTLTGIDFNIANIGFFCYGDLNLQFDNFAAAEGDSAYCPASIITNKKHIPAISLLRNGAVSTYDILGRSIRSMNLNKDFDNRSHVSSGVYIKSAYKRGLIQLK